MQNTESILEGHSNVEKGAYLSTIASIATADRKASAEELSNLAILCDAAGIENQQRQQVMQAAEDEQGTELIRNLDVLKNSELKYPLLADLISFAKSDSDYNEAEHRSVEKISQYLEVNQVQFSLLNQFVDKTTAPEVSAAAARQPGFLSALGIEDKLKNAGINAGGLLKGLLTVAAPLILGKLLSKRSGNSAGGLGGMLNGNAGGLGSVIDMFTRSNGGGGFGNAGGMLGKILGGLR